MLLYGSSGASREIAQIPDSVIYNFTSLSEQHQNICLMPPNSLGAVNSQDFSDRYRNWIYNNDMVFANFMTMIVQVQAGTIVYLEIDDEYEWSEILIEDLLTMVLERYGIVALKISSIDDLIYCNYENSNVAAQCMLNYDTDYQRYEFIREKQRITEGGSINVSES